MKTLIVGDLHGRLHIAEKALATDYNIVFMGDYVDSFDVPIPTQIKTLDTVLDAVHNSPERVVALVGNHERSYLNPEGELASGFKQETHAEIMCRDLSVLKDYYWLGNFLISHAGVSNEYLERYSMSVQDYLEAGEYKQVGYARGGWNSVGGLYWCDWFDEFDPVVGVPQIVGHSGYRPAGSGGLGILQKGNSYNVDCFEHKEEFLLLNGGEVEIITL